MDDTKMPQVAFKKGNSSWKPASVTDVTNKEEGYRYRWARKDPDNLYKKESEGWETVSGLTSDKVKPEETNRINDGRNISSVHEKHDVILMRIPEEVAQGRDAYYNAESERRVAGLTAHIKKDLAKEGANTHGDITISSRKG
jgi:hypothetical protein